MKIIKYTPDAADKLRSLKKEMMLRYGSKKAKEVVESDCIRIVNIYNEKEDFLWLLFGIDTTPQETLDYWGEKF